MSQHEISGSVKYIHQRIISSLKGLREVSNSNRTSKSGQLTDKADFNDSHILKICVPTLLLEASLKNEARTSYSATTLNVTVSGIRTAFTKPDIDITSLSWLTMAYFNSHQMSPESIVDVTEALFKIVADPPQALLLGSPADLVHRYIQLCLTYPPSIPRKYTLDPMARVLSKVSGRLANNSCELRVSDLCLFLVRDLTNFCVTFHVKCAITGITVTCINFCSCSSRDRLVK